MLRCVKNLVLTILAIALSTNIVLAGEWYEDYESAKKAIAKQQWQEALSLLNSALSVKKKASANARTYGLHFIDYFPYLYRGIANYHLGDFIASEVDLKRSADDGQIKKARRDRNAGKELEDYLRRLTARKNEQEGSVANRALEMARKLTDQRKYAMAAKVLRDFLEKEPLHREGQALLKEIEPQLAAEAAKASGKKSPPIAKESEAKKHVAKTEKTEIPKPLASKKNDRTGVEKGTDVDQRFRNGQAFFKAGDLKAARRAFEGVGEANANYMAASEFLQKIDNADKHVREGIISFFDGKTEESIKWLNQALGVYQTNLNVYAFLGCAHATAYFLSGEEDRESLQKALAEFDRIKEMDSGYQLESRYFSPRIIDLFVQARQN